MPFTQFFSVQSHQVSSSVTLLFAAILVGMVVTLALEEKIHAKKSVITGLFAVITIFLGAVFHVLPFGPVTNVFDHELHIPVYITGIEWEVIAVIVGSSLFVDVTSRSGIYSWLALSLTKRSGGDPRKLLWYYSVLTVLFSAFLNNVTAMIIIGSLTAVSLKKLGKTQFLLGFLLIEATLTNVGGLLTLISSVPNIIVGSTAGISFMQFTKISILYVIFTSAVTVWMGAKLFSISSLKTEEEMAEAAELVASFDENDSVNSKSFFYFSAVAFVLLIVFFASASYLPYLKDLGLGFVALSFGLLALWRYKSEVQTFYAGLDWDLIWFFLTLFVVINGMEHAGVLAAIGTGIEQIIEAGPNIGSAGLLWASALASSVTDNIPLSAVLAKILAARVPATPLDSTLWWSVIFGANLGGNLTPIGSASTVVAVTLMHKHKLGVGFMRFVKLVLPYAIVQLIAATVFILLIAPYLI